MLVCRCQATAIDSVRGREVPHIFGLDFSFHAMVSSFILEIQPCVLAQTANPDDYECPAGLHFMRVTP